MQLKADLLAQLAKIKATLDAVAEGIAQLHAQRLPKIIAQPSVEEGLANKEQPK